MRSKVVGTGRVEMRMRRVSWVREGVACGCAVILGAKMKEEAQRPSDDGQLRAGTHLATEEPQSSHESQQLDCYRRQKPHPATTCPATPQFTSNKRQTSWPSCILFAIYTQFASAKGCFDI